MLVMVSNVITITVIVQTIFDPEYHLSQNIKISLLLSRPSGFTLVLVASPMTRATLTGAGTGSPLRALIDQICSLIKYFSSR